MMYGIKIHGTPIGIATAHDGRWLSFYDATRGPHGRIESTSDPAKALRFADQEDAMVLWRKSNGLRPDGRPNRPLTAFTISIEPLPDASPTTPA